MFLGSAGIIVLDEGQINLKQVNQVSPSSVSHKSHGIDSVAAPAFNFLYRL